MSIIDSIINIFNKNNKGVVATMTDQDIVTALNALPTLSKPHYWWPLDGIDSGTILTTRLPLLNALVRTTRTGCLSVEWSGQNIVNNIVAACKTNNGTIGLMSSPYQKMMAKNLPATDYGVDYQTDINNLDANLNNKKTWIDAANKTLGCAITVPFLHFDIESWLVSKESKTDIIKKLKAVNDLAKKYFPNTRVVFYQHAAVVYWANDTGWSDSVYDFFTYDPTEPGYNDHAMVPLYQPVEWYMMQTMYDKTCERADKMGIKDVFPWVSLGTGGYRQGAGFIGWDPADALHDYPIVNSWAAGFAINHPWANARPIRFGKFGRAPAVFLYPPPISFPTQAWHLIAYVKGANNIPL